MDDRRNSWLTSAQEALGPKERTNLGEAASGESVVDHLVRIARLSKRAPARRAALGALLPAARDRLQGVIELAVDLLYDRSKSVRYEACRALAVALDPATLPRLQQALSERIDVPYDGLERAFRAVGAGRRDAFLPGIVWVLQDEYFDHSTKAARVRGSSAYGTARG